MWNLFRVNSKDTSAKSATGPELTNKDNRAMCEACTKITVNTLEWCKKFVQSYQ